MENMQHPRELEIEIRIKIEILFHVDIAIS